MVLAIAILAAGEIHPARADLFGVYTTVSGGGQGCGAGYTYSTPNGGSGGQSTTPSFSDFGDCTNTFTGTAAPGLTSAFAQAGESMNFGGPPNGLMSASQNAATDLRSASMHTFANATLDANGNGGISTSYAETRLWDTLTFSIPGAADSTVTQVNVEFTADGTLVGKPTHIAALSLASGGVGCFPANSDAPSFCTNPNTANWAWSEGQFVGEFGNGGLVTAWNVSQNTSTNLDVIGTLSLVGANPVIGLWAGLSIYSVVPGTTDFSNTANINFQLPSGVTFTSASGQFGAGPSAVPEPSSVVLLAGGLCLAALIRRRLSATPR